MDPLPPRFAPTAASGEWSQFHTFPVKQIQFREQIDCPYQKILCNELDEVFGDDTGREVNAKDLAKLQYLEMCIKESLRLFPPVYLITREAKQELELGQLSTIRASETSSDFIT